MSATEGTSPLIEQVVEHAAGTDGRQLVGVADEQHVGARADGAQQRVGEPQRQHRRLVDHEQVRAGDRV